MICLNDIAHSLSHISLANGHYIYFYSVAHHSINCANEAFARWHSNEVLLGCLFHEASEAYISDISRRNNLCFWRLMNAQIKVLHIYCM